MEIKELFRLKIKEYIDYLIELSDNIIPELQERIWQTMEEESQGKENTFNWAKRGFNVLDYYTHLSYDKQIEIAEHFGILKKKRYNNRRK